MTRKSRQGGSEQRFGGDWTERKLDIVTRYLAAYTTALKNTGFEKLYVDAFAGSGYRESARDESRTSGLGLFQDLADVEPQALLEGSARRALATNPRFDRYVFIERQADRCAQLEDLRNDFPGVADAIDIRQGEANEEIQRLCLGDWRGRRAVVFLDPYGMQVEWTTIEAIARTGAIDLWILFPLGIGVNRLLGRAGDIPDSWRRRLDLLLGTKDWYDEFYQVETEPTLFGGEEERVTKASMETIGKYFLQRLDSVFAGVAPGPAVLRNTRNAPLYLLCFAVGNARGKDIALKIANHLLKG